MPEAAELPTRREEGWRYSAVERLQGEALEALPGFVPVNEDLRWARVAQEARRAVGQPVGSGVQHGDEVAALDGWQHQLVAELVCGRAQGPPDGHGPSVAGARSDRRDHRRSPNDGAEPGRRRRVVHAAVGDCVEVAAARLGPDHLRHVDAGRRREEPA